MYLQKTNTLLLKSSSSDLLLGKIKGESVAIEDTLAYYIIIRDLHGNINRQPALFLILPNHISRGGTATTTASRAIKYANTNSERCTLGPWSLGE